MLRKRKCKSRTITQTIKKPCYWCCALLNIAIYLHSKFKVNNLIRYRVMPRIRSVTVTLTHAHVLVCARTRIHAHTHTHIHTITHTHIHTYANLSTVPTSLSLSAGDKEVTETNRLTKNVLSLWWICNNKHRRDRVRWNNFFVRRISEKSNYLKNYLSCNANTNFKAQELQFIFSINVSKINSHCRSSDNESILAKSIVEPTKMHTLQNIFNVYDCFVHVY